MKEKKGSKLGKAEVASVPALVTRKSKDNDLALYLYFCVDLLGGVMATKNLYTRPLKKVEKNKGGHWMLLLTAFVRGSAQRRLRCSTTSLHTPLDTDLSIGFQYAASNAISQFVPKAGTCNAA